MKDDTKKQDNDVKIIEDSFDLKRLRLSQNFAEQIGVKKALITVPVRKPDRQWFIRTHPDPRYRCEVAILEMKEDRESYLVDPVLWPELPGEVAAKLLFTAINRQGVVFLLPARLPNPNGRRDEWGRSLLEGAGKGMDSWVRIVANLGLGAYEVFEATAALPEPEWPNEPFEKLVEIGFRDRIIRAVDHPVLKKLRGEL